MSEEYKSVLTGGLSLKGGLFKKKKNKRKLENAEKVELEVTGTPGDGAEQGGTESSGSDGGEKNGEEESNRDDETLTRAQRQLREKQLERERKKIRGMVKKTHRERVEEFNALLASMTEHNDIPRCSAAGNG